MIQYSALLEKFKQLLKNNELKFTKQREFILKALYDNEGHFTPEELHDLIKKKAPNLNTSIATIYRTLGLLEESKIINSISFGSKGKKYEFGLKSHHDHLICIECGALIEFEDEVIETRQSQIAKEHNFKMTNHTMNIFGICENCQNTDQNR